MEDIIVLMSTYNGEDYLKEQIESILTQEGVNVLLLIRDDGSKDGTIQILDKYQSEYKNIVIFKECNIGCKKSFFKLAEYACEYKDIKYFAFADQDDVWLPGKLFSGIKYLQNFENDIPALYFCTPKIVDSNLKTINRKWPSHYLLTFGEACIIQPSAGCTMVFNRSLIELFLKASPEIMRLHDSWIYKCVLYCDGKVVEDFNELLLYRQHNNNVVGAKRSFFQNLRRRYTSFTKRKNERLNTIRNFVKVYSRDINPKILSELNKLINYQESLKDKIHILFSNQFRTNNRVSNLLFKISILFNRY